MMLTRLLLTFLAILIFSDTYSQTEKGGFLIGGSGSVGYNTVQIISSDINTIQNNVKIRTIGASFYPNGSYFLLNNLAIGIVSGLNLSYSKIISENFLPRSDRFTNLSIGPQFRYFFPYQRFAFFPQVQYLIGMESDRREVLNPMTNLYETRKTNSKNGIFQMGIGAAYFLTRSVAVEGILNYNSYQNLNETLPIDQNRFIEPHHYSFSFNLGLQFYLNKSQVK